MARERVCQSSIKSFVAPSQRAAKKSVTAASHRPTHERNNMLSKNTNDRKREEVSRPNAGVAAVHDKKGKVSAPSAGVTTREDKAAYDQIHGCSGISKPSQGGHVREEKRDENTSNPQGADDHNGPVLKERLHEDKKKFEHDRRHEPRSKGTTDSGGGKFKSTKVD